MVIFPLLEFGLFSGSVMTLNAYPLISLLLLLLASVALCFSIHIFFHECAHRHQEYPALYNWLATIMIGLPFDGYRIHHYNHHRFENGAKDFSTTWIHTDKSILPRSVLSYTLGWPRQLIAGMGRKNPLGEEGCPSIADKIKKRIPAQKTVLLIIFLVTAVLNWKALLLYIGLIYFGWAFTSLQNYGQHPPCEGGPVTTFANRLYNQLFFNNGLHWEHHHSPEVHWNYLTLREESYRIPCAHLFNPLRQEQYSE